jgi:hypothetical protein
MRIQIYMHTHINNDTHKCITTGVDGQRPTALIIDHGHASSVSYGHFVPVLLAHSSLRSRRSHHVRC